MPKGKPKSGCEHLTSVHERVRGVSLVRQRTLVMGDGYKID